MEELGWEVGVDLGVFGGEGEVVAGGFEEEAALLWEEEALDGRKVVGGVLVEGLCASGGVHLGDSPVFVTDL